MLTEKDYCDSRIMKKELFDEINLKKMGEVLKYWRKKNNISLYDLSNTMQINYHAIRNIEEGNQNVQLKILNGLKITGNGKNFYSRMYNVYTE